MLAQYANVQPCSEQGDAAIVQHLIDAITKRGTNNSNDDVRFVMIGTSTLGTEQFLRIRSQLTRQLIERHGFSMLAIEADYPDGFELNQYVQGLNGYASKVIDESSSSPSSPPRVLPHPLSKFQRFPRWVWNNEATFQFMNWLRQYNKEQDQSNNNVVKCFGLDLYSLQSSINVITDYLERNHSNCELFNFVKRCYSEFDRFSVPVSSIYPPIVTTTSSTSSEHSIGSRNRNNNLMTTVIDTDRYTYQTGLQLSESCQQQVIEALEAMLSHHHRANGNDTFFFHCIENAKLIRNAEHYYRNLFLNTETCTPSWNIRDQHMFDTLVDLIQYYYYDDNGSHNNANDVNHQREHPKVIIWAHNAHVAADNSGVVPRGVDDDEVQINLGQRIREHFGAQSTFSIGMFTYEGTVSAAKDWTRQSQRQVQSHGSSSEVRQLRKALDGSYEKFFHDFLVDNPCSHDDQSTQMTPQLLPIQQRQLSLVFDDSVSDWESVIPRGMLERNVGAVYDDEKEEDGTCLTQYMRGSITQRYDAIVHIDKTDAIGPFRVSPEMDGDDVVGGRVVGASSRRTVPMDYSPSAFPGLSQPGLTISKRDMMEEGYLDVNEYETQEERQCLSKKYLEESYDLSDA